MVDWSRSLDRDRLENDRQGEEKSSEHKCLKGLQELGGEWWTGRVEKRRVVGKDNVERRTGRGWRRGE